MSGFVQARTNSAAKRAEAASGLQASGITGAEQAAPQALFLLQMRQALDRSPRVQLQAALQRALDRATTGGRAPQKPKEKPTLQMKRVELGDDHGKVAVIQRRYAVPDVNRFGLLKIGKSQSHVVDEHVTPEGKPDFTQHFHCNDWKETTSDFASFTGSFIMGAPEKKEEGRADKSKSWRPVAPKVAQAVPKFHFTIPENSKNGAWQGQPQPTDDQGKERMSSATTGKFEALIEPLQQPEQPVGGGGSAANPQLGQDQKSNVNK